MLDIDLLASRKRTSRWRLEPSSLGEWLWFAALIGMMAAIWVLERSVPVALWLPVVLLPVAPLLVFVLPFAVRVRIGRRLEGRSAAPVVHVLDARGLAATPQQRKAAAFVERLGDEEAANPRNWVLLVIGGILRRLRSPRWDS